MHELSRETRVNKYLRLVLARCRLRVDSLAGFKIDLLIRPVAVADSTLFEIVRGHFYLHPVAGEDAYAMHTHAPCQRTEDRVILCLWTEDFDLKGGVWEGFLYNAYEFNNVLRHKQYAGIQAARAYVAKSS